MGFIDKKKLKHDYQYSSMPEKIPLSVKRVLKKMKNPNGANMTVSYRKPGWVRAMSLKYKDGVIRKGRKNIVTDIRTSESYAMLSYRTEKLIQEISDKKYYTFEDMMVINDPFYQAPLTAIAIFYTKEPYAVRYTVKGKTKEADYTATVDPAKKHRVPILGLYPETQNMVLMQLIDENNKVVKERKVQIWKGPLPEKMKDVVTCSKHTKPSAFPFIMLSGGMFIRTLAFDCNGDIRYYLRRQTKAYGIFPLSQGKFLYMEKWVDIPCYSVSQACMMYEMDYLGRVYKTYLYHKGFHHCAKEMEPGGNFIMGSNSMEGNEENAVIEIERNTGKIVKELNLCKLFDEKYSTTPDWIHVNAVSYNKDNHCIIVCMRNIHSVAKINWDTDELVWILSDPQMWAGTRVEDKVLVPEGDVKSIFQQHAAYEVEDLDGNPDTMQLIVYDNHWARRVPVPFYDGDEAHSYISIYTINEKKHTVSMHHMTQVDNSRIRSNAILEIEKNRIFNMAGDLVPDIEENKGMVEEYDYETNELLNRYFVKPGFFTAYPFEPDVNTMHKSLHTERNYWQGDTFPTQEYKEEQDWQSAKKLSIKKLDEEDLDMLENEETDVSANEDETDISANKETQTEDMAKSTEKEIVLHFQEDLLFVKAVDHSISYIYFVGQNQKYYVDLTGTYQTMDIFKDKVYEIPIWVKDMTEDTYHIYYKYNGELYDSDDEFTIS